MRSYVYRRPFDYRARRLWIGTLTPVPPGGGSAITFGTIISRCPDPILDAGIRSECWDTREGCYGVRIGSEARESML